ncbi:hypothetical protein [Lacticaseibacillus brantae]|nr:hypothetical protein [Lacticaseibacillus brantae]
MPLLGLFSYYWGVRPHQGSQYWVQFTLWLSSLFFFTTWQGSLLQVGLIVWASQDWRERRIAAVPLEFWSVLVAWPHWQPAVIGLVLGLSLGWISGGFGSGDAIIVAALAGYFPLTAVLWVLLLACLSTLAHHYHHNEATYPFAFHLAVGVQVWLWLSPLNLI